MIEVTRETRFHGHGRLRPFGYTYRCIGPNGTRFDNSNIITLRRILRQRYGKDVEIAETWMPTGQ
jgi:hypothetical protein